VENILSIMCVPAATLSSKQPFSGFSAFQHFSNSVSNQNRKLKLKVQKAKRVF